MNDTVAYLIRLAISYLTSTVVGSIVISNVIDFLLLGYSIIA
jgi:hypothetical protein